MNIWESIVVSIESLRLNKLRSTLTLIGIIVGVAAVVTVVSVGEAGKVSLASEYEKYPKSVFFIVPATADKSREELEQAALTPRDVEEMAKLDGVASVSGIASAIMESEFGKETLRFNMMIANADLVKTENVNMAAGRFFTRAEERGRQEVVVIDTDLAEKRFGSAESAVHKRIQLKGKMYTIVGVFKTEANLLSDFMEKRYGIYVTPQSIPGSGGTDKLQYSYIQVKASAERAGGLQEVMNDVRRATAKRHNVPPEAYIAQSSEETQQVVKRVFGILQVIVGSIAGVSLLVGGVGVMNIMLVSVTERTREIGIRKAIGATPGAIMGQFLIEAIVLCSIGGFGGTALGIGGAYLFSLFTKWPFIVSWWTVLAAFGFSAAIGIFFGLYPSNKAARLQPIESLRYE